MKTFKRFLVVAMSMCMTIGLIMTPIHAKETPCIEELFNGYYVAYDTDGNITDYNMPIPQEEYIAKMNQRYSSVVELDHGTRIWYDHGYHPFTDIWRRVSSYNFSKTETVNVSLSISFLYAGSYVTGNGTLAVSQGVSYASGYTIDVDQSRDSKLRVITDFDWTYYKGIEYDNYTGNYLYEYNFTTFVKTAERFIPEYR